MLKSPVQVAVAIIQDECGRILINQRQLDKEHAGWWEFPGGKINRDETVSDALIRECKEELGIIVLKFHSLLELSHKYPNKTVLLSVFIIDSYQGLPASMEGQKLEWKTLNELSNLDLLLPADKPILDILAKNSFS